MLWSLRPARSALPAVAMSELLSQSFWLVDHMQVPSNLPQEAERVKEHPPLELDSTTSGRVSGWFATCRS